MDKQKDPPVESPFFEGDIRRMNPIWRRWFQALAVRDDEIRRRPYKTYTADATLTTWELGKTVLFDIGASDVTCTMPTVEAKDLWAWITIVRMGTGRFAITAPGDDYVERNAKVITCEEQKRVTANVTLQLITTTQWAIIGATGIWRVKPYAI